MPPVTKGAAFARGLRSVVSVAAGVLFVTALGFGALARDGGFTIGHTAFMALTMFALPNQVVLVDQLSRGAGLAAAAFAVTLTAVRLLPMTVTLVPLLKGARSRPLLELLVSHFVAITTWIEGSRHLPSLVPDVRLAYYFGLGLAIGGSMVAGSLTGYALAGGVPPVLSAAFLFLTPLYFILSLLASSSTRMDWAAVILGCALAPLLYLLMPGFDLLATGIIGGTVAYLGARGTNWRRYPSRRR
jgi:predicted branched-subunit amino acid permease